MQKGSLDAALWFEAVSKGDAQFVQCALARGTHPDELRNSVGQRKCGR